MDDSRWEPNGWTSSVDCMVYLGSCKQAVTDNGKAAMKEEIEDVSLLYIMWALLDTRPGADFYTVNPIRRFEERALVSLFLERRLLNPRIQQLCALLSCIQPALSCFPT